MRAKRTTVYRSIKGIQDCIHLCERFFENIVNLVQHNLYLDLTNYIVNSHASIPKYVIQVVNDIEKQEVTPDRIQFRNIYHKSILSDIFADNDLYDKDSYASDPYWKIGKEPETNLKKIGFDINVNDNEIDDLKQRCSSSK